jgi:hypothetical protein
MENKKNIGVKQFTWSFNKSQFPNKFHDNIHDCIIDAYDAHTDEKIVFVGEVERPNIRLSTLGDHVLERITDDLYNEIGDFTVGFHPTRENKGELNNKIEYAAKEWLIDVGYFCFKVVNIDAYDIETGELMREV